MTAKNKHLDDNYQVNNFFKNLEELSPSQLSSIDAEQRRFAVEASDETMQRWEVVMGEVLNPSGVAGSRTRKRIADVIERDLDITELRTATSGATSVIKRTAFFAVLGILNRQKLTDEEYGWCVDPYLAAGFPREIFYPENSDTQG